ncbi:BrxA/BrxB family bacilliredoxin [Sporosarcina gallistercoris]|uniref:BrxA/BrxB family bacilliredoxin n=1 Tax=Sporosarcina gallistercoris TaxID=2762245 RepID=A0ABR8PJG6_9BACL|nr:BrxA/BrxB family bacilliredoxin [Sporosarcina gallistercoris]MBD7908336.1 BrxA/BrxB family bacilliredoxin [Sporosarcina gallistercoris]
MNAYEEYMQGIVQPMRQELVASGFTELLTVEDVTSAMEEHKGTALVVINSVCGCAAGLARPAVREALSQAEQQPDHLFTVFAGQEKEATAQMRNYFPEVPPSSPSIAIVKNGELAYFIPREQIEGFEMEQVRDHLTGALNQVTAL